MWSGYSEQGRGSQERGPGQFSVQVPGAQQARTAGEQAVPMQGGVRGGAVAPTSNVVVPQVQDKTFSTLMRLGQERLAKDIQKLEEKAFLQGVTRAASGQALDEIIAEQPWYSRIFGDSAVVEGARAYTAQSTVENWVSQIEGRMPELRQLSPGEVPDLLGEGLSELMTGDADTDAVIQAQVLKVVPGLIKRHTKEHYEFRQQQASDARRGAFRSASALVEEAFATDKYSPEDRDLRKLGLMETLVIPEGADVESWYNDVKGFVEESAASGNFHTIATFRESGLMDQLEPEDRATIERKINEWANTHRTNADPEWHTRAGLLIAQIESRRIGAEEGVKQIAALNDEWTRRTGNPRPLISPTQLGSAVESAAKAFYRAQEQEAAAQRQAIEDAATEEERAAAEAMRQASLVTLALQGSIDVAVAKESEKDAALVSAFTTTAQRDPNAAHNVLVSNFVNRGYVSPTIKAEAGREWRASLGSEEITASFQSAYGRWRMFNFVLDQQGNITGVREGAAGASAAYFGSEMDSEMGKFHAMTGGGADIPNLGDAAFRAIRQGRPAAYSEEKRTLFGEAARGEFSTGFRVFGVGWGRKLSNGQLDAIIHEARKYEKDYAHLEPKEAAKRALGAAQANGLEVAGPGAWTRQTGQRPFAAALGLPTSEIDEHLSAEFSQRLEALDLPEPESVSWFRTADRNGIPQLSAVVYADGRVQIIGIDGEAIRQRYRKAAEPQQPAPTMGDLTSQRIRAGAYIPPAE